MAAKRGPDHHVEEALRAVDDLRRGVELAQRVAPRVERAVRTGAGVVRDVRSLGLRGFVARHAPAVVGALMGRGDDPPAASRRGDVIDVEYVSNGPARRP